MGGIKLLETMRVRGGRVPLWALHLRRLVTSARTLGLSVPSPLTPPGGGADRAVRLELDDGVVRVSEREVGSTAALHLVSVPGLHQPYPHKTTNRSWFEAALAGAKARGASDALLTTVEGWVAEATIWSVLWWEGERLAAPPLDMGVLPGVGRNRLVELAGPLLEHRITVEELRERRLALLAVNAVRGVVAVGSLDGVSLAQSPRTAWLSERFWA